MSNQGMYRVITKITFVQQPNADFPGRNRTLTYNFANSVRMQRTPGDP
jgi:hypothetical protein